MILFPQDDYKSWSGKYPPEVVQREFTRMADQWEQALTPFRKAIETVPQVKKRQALEDLAIAETCYIHFRSTANQIAFYLARDGARTHGIACAHARNCEERDRTCAKNVSDCEAPFRHRLRSIEPLLLPAGGSRRKDSQLSVPSRSRL